MAIPWTTTTNIRLPEDLESSSAKVAKYQYHTGYADAIRLIICTWIVVSAMIANIPCTIARRARLISPAEYGPRRAVNATNDEYNTVASTGAARTKSGKLEKVQYLKKPTFLYTRQSFFLF